MSLPSQALVNHHARLRNTETHLSGPLPWWLPQPMILEVLRLKYLQPGETGVGDVMDRVAHALASVEASDRRTHWQAVFRQQMAAGAMGSGRIMALAGATQEGTLASCFVQPVGDCLSGRDAADQPGIHEAMAQAARTLQQGGGVGYDFSRIRPQGARINGSGMGASGPCRFIDHFDQACLALQNTGCRRGAQMAVLRCDHPDVLDFVKAKQSPGRWSTFNVSVGITDAFMQAVEQDRLWDLVHSMSPRDWRPTGAVGPYVRGDGLWVYQSLPARQLWEAMAHGAHQSGEPGVLFLDTLERDNNLRAIETLHASNPCGEQPLPAYGACVLGPLILPAFVCQPFGLPGHATNAWLDWPALTKAVHTQVRALDNALDMARWPLSEHAREAEAKRRVGVGFTGLADALAMLGLRYDSVAGRAMARRVAQTLRDQAYAASVALAKERGPYPLFDADVTLAPGTFASRLPPSLRASVRKHGLRNSHLLSIAPTGSVSLAFADNCSSGIEPIFDKAYTRVLQTPNGQVQRYEVQDHAWRVYQSLGRSGLVPDVFVTAWQMQPEDQLAMVATVQPFVDGAISKTLNLPPNASIAAVQALLMQAWREGLKGLALYRPNRVHSPVLRPAECSGASAKSEASSGCP